MQLFNFFKTSSYILIALLWLVGLTIIGDTLIHPQELRFTLITIALGFIFMLFGWLWLVVYQNFRRLFELQIQLGTPTPALKRLMLIFGIVAGTMTLLALIINLALWQRMLNYAILG